MTCLVSCLTRALELLDLDKQGGKLVIITWGGPVTAGESAKQVEYFQVRVFSLLGPSKFRHIYGQIN